MGCSSCGNSGCSGCNSCGSPCNPVTQNCTPSCTVSACPPVGCYPATPSPYYGSVPTCQENHAQETIINQFAAAICTISSFNIPAIGETSFVYFNGLSTLPVGLFLFHTDYGYLEVTGFNSQTGQVALTNNGEVGNASPGTGVPACTCFTISSDACCPNLLAVTNDGASSAGSAVLDTDGESVSCGTTTRTFINTSTTKTMRVLVNFIFRANINAIGNTVQPDGTLVLAQSLDGGAYSTLISMPYRENTLGLGSGGTIIPIHMVSNTVHNVLPGVTLTVTGRSTVTLTSATSSRILNVQSLVTEVSGIGVAVD